MSLSLLYCIYRLYPPFRIMRAQQILRRLRHQPKRKRFIFEFAKQLNLCIELAFLTVSAEQFWVVEYQLRRTLDIVDIVVSLLFMAPLVVSLLFTAPLVVSPSVYFMVPLVVSPPLNPMTPLVVSPIILAPLVVSPSLNPMTPLVVSLILRMPTHVLSSTNNIMLSWMVNCPFLYESGSYSMCFAFLLIGIVKSPSEVSFYILYDISPRGSPSISLRVTPKNMLYKHVRAGSPISRYRFIISFAIDRSLRTISDSLTEHSWPSYLPHLCCLSNNLDE